MVKKQSKKNSPCKKDLSPGAKFWEEYLNTPYTNDRVGQAFVIPYRGKLPENKKEVSEHNQDHEPSTRENSTQDPGLKFLEELDRIPYTYDRVGQVSVSSWKGRPFRNTTSKRKLEDLDSNNDQSTNH